MPQNRPPHVGPFLKIALVLALCLSPALAGAADLTVSAASSLTDAFKVVKEAFEKKHPGVTVINNFAASGALLKQIENGAPVDVFASADQKTMDQAAAGKLIVAGTRKDFAQNGLVLIQPADAKVALKSEADLTGAGVRRIAMGNPESVPVGRYTQAALTAARLWEPLQPKIVPGQNVRQVLDYVIRGEVEAGFVFSTDAFVAGGKVRIVKEMPTTSPVSYPVAVIAASRNPAAKAYVDFLLSPEGQKILQGFGFKKP